MKFSGLKSNLVSTGLCNDTYNAFVYGVAASSSPVHEISSDIYNESKQNHTLFTCPI